MKKESISPWSRVFGIWVVAVMLGVPLVGRAQPMDQEPTFTIDFVKMKGALLFNTIEKIYGYLVTAPPPLTNMDFTIRSQSPMNIDQAYELLLAVLQEKQYYAFLDKKQRVLDIVSLQSMDKNKLKRLVEPRVESLRDSAEPVVAEVKVGQEASPSVVRAIVMGQMKLPDWVKIEADASRNTLEIIATSTLLRQIIPEIRRAETASSIQIQGMSVRVFQLKYVRASYAFQMLKHLLKLESGPSLAGAGEGGAGGSLTSGRGSVSGFLAGQATLNQATLNQEASQFASRELPYVMGKTTSGVQYQLYLEEASNSVNAVAPPPVLMQIEQFFLQVDVEPTNRSRVPFLHQSRMFALNYISAETAIELLSRVFESLYQDSATGSIAPASGASNSTVSSRRSTTSGRTGGTTGTGGGGTTGTGGGGTTGTGGGGTTGTGGGGTTGTGTTTNDSGVVGSGATRATTQGVVTQGGAVSREIAGRISFIADLASNNLMVLAQLKDLEIVEESLKRFDRPYGQVLIEIAVMEVALTDDWQFGMAHMMKGQLITSQQTGGEPIGVNAKFLHDPSLADPGFLPSFSSTEPSLVLFSSDNLQSLIRLLSRKARLSVISSPKVIAQNNKEAQISVTDGTYWIKITRDVIPEKTVNGVTTPFQVIENEVPVMTPTGLVLTVKPKINEQNEVFLDIGINLDEISGPPLKTNFPPIISTRNMTVSANVKQGESIVIGGIVKNSTAKTEIRTPILSSLPLIGSLFSNTVDSDSKRELLMFLTPHVMKGPDDVEHMMEIQRNKHPNVEWPVPKE